MRNHRQEWVVQWSNKGTGVKSLGISSFKFSHRYENDSTLRCSIYRLHTGLDHEVTAGNDWRIVLPIELVSTSKI